MNTMSAPEMGAQSSEVSNNIERLAAEQVNLHDSLLVLSRRLDVAMRCPEPAMTNKPEGNVSINSALVVQLKEIRAAVQRDADLVEDMLNRLEL